MVPRFLRRLSTPIEIAESEWPIVVERYALVPDSGGAGKHRGGLAVERVWRCLLPDTILHNGWLENRAALLKFAPGKAPSAHAATPPPLRAR